MIGGVAGEREHVTTVITLPKFLGRRNVFLPEPVVKTAVAIKRMVGVLLGPFRRIHRRQRGEDDPRWPDAEKPAPLRPTPVHHLVAAKAIPPSDETFLFPAD
jgi:hypothetical protein